MEKFGLNPGTKIMEIALNSGPHGVARYDFVSSGPLHGEFIPLGFGLPHRVLPRLRFLASLLPMFLRVDPRFQEWPTDTLVQSGQNVESYQVPEDVEAIF